MFEIVLFFIGFYVNVACLVLHLGSRFDNRDSFCNRVASLIENVRGISIRMHFFIDFFVSFARRIRRCLT